MQKKSQKIRNGIVSGIRADDATVAAFGTTKVPLILIGMEDERLTRRTSSPK